MPSASRLRRLAQVVATAAIAFGALAPAALVSSSPAAAADPVTLRIGISQTATDTALNPFLAESGQDWLMMPDIYDLLIEFGPNLEPAPGLAEKWETSADGLTWTYHIRQGATWQDGQPLTASDVAFTFNYIRDSHNPAYTGPLAPDGNDTDGDGSADNPLSLYDNYLDLSDGYDNTRITSIEATDPNTLVIKTTAPLPILSQPFIPIVPEHIWNKVTFKDAQDFLNPNPIGSGPFQMADFQPDQVMRLTANKNYWGGAPKIDEVIYQYFDNEQAEIAALQSGQIDFINEVPVTLVSAIKDNPAITINQAPSSDFVELGFNSWNPDADRFKSEGCSDCDKGPTNGSLGNPWLVKPDVRAALAQLVDKQALVDKAVNGYATPGESLIGPVDQTYEFKPKADDPATYPGDQQAAIARFQAVMAKYGFTDTDGDGFLNVPDTDDGRAFDPNGAGKNWSLRLYVRDDKQNDIVAGGLIQTWFEAAGVQLDVQQVKEDPFLYDATFPSSTNADMDLYLWGWGPDPDPDFMLSVFTCGQINNWQDANYCDPSYDDLYRQQQTAGDPTERKKLVGQLQQKLYTDSPYSVLWYSDTLEAYRNDRFTGFVQHPTSGGALWGGWGYGPYGSRLTVQPAAQALAGSVVFDGRVIAADPTALPPTEPTASASLPVCATPSIPAEPTEIAPPTEGAEPTVIVLPTPCTPPTASPIPEPTFPPTPPATPEATAELPTVEPTAPPTAEPTLEPTPKPTPKPTKTPKPTAVVTAEPTVEPTPKPTKTPKPTAQPTAVESSAVETVTPTEIPTVLPTEVATVQPTVEPTPKPTKTPKPTAKPTKTPKPTPQLTVPPETPGSGGGGAQTEQPTETAIVATPTPASSQAPAAPSGSSGPSILFLVLVAIAIAGVFIVGAIWYVGRQERNAE